MLNASHGKSNGKSNLLALFVSLVSLSAIFCCFDPVPAGEDLSSSPDDSSFLTDVPLPRDPFLSIASSNAPSSDSETGSTAEVSDETSAESSAQTVLPSAAVRIDPVDETSSTGLNRLSSQDALTFSYLLTQEGCRFMESVKSYSVIFSKKERLQGDLSELQNIEMKIRHTPHFSVYMKWKNGDTGRQLLYNEEYEDGKMSVKLGGFKGRILPAIKLLPTSPEAMAEARYPVTEAGLLGMLRQLLYYRRNEVSSGEGVRCVRLPNTVVDDRECYCFLHEYQSPAVNATYRRSLVMLDTRHRIPMRVINHTWSQSAASLTPEELDAQTLIEDYTFSRVDFGRQLAAEDFRRENPAYRM